MEGEGAIFTIEADVVIEAIGQSPNPLLISLIENLERGRRGNVIVDSETGQTSIDNVYAAGDVATGAATVIEAMCSAKKTARAINDKLRE